MTVVLSAFAASVLVVLVVLLLFDRWRRRLRAERLEALAVGMRELGLLMGRRGEACEFLGAAGPMLQFRRGDERFAIDANDLARIVMESAPEHREGKLVWLLARAAPGAPEEAILPPEA